MNWESDEMVEFVAKMDGKMGDELRLVMVGIHHVDARIGHLQTIGYYACAVLTGILLTLWVR